MVRCIILVGMFAGRRGILGENARSVLSALTFFVASPALLFETLSKARLYDVFAAPLLVTAAGANTTAALFFVIVRFLLKRSVPESLMSSMGTSLAARRRRALFPAPVGWDRPWACPRRSGATA